MPRGLSEFKKVLSDFRDVSALGVKGSLAAPLFDTWAKAGPPPSLFISLGASLGQFLALVYVYHFWYDKDRAVLDKRMKGALIAFISLFFLSFFAVGMYTFPRGGGLERVVEGYQIRPDVQPTLTGGFTVSDALQGTQYDATEVWTKGSVAVMSTLLPILWIGAFVALAVFLATFTMVQRRDGP